jgi:hypothetical protein
MARPAAGEFNAYYQPYIDKVKGNSIAEIITHHSQETEEFYSSLPLQEAGFAYAPGKWSIAGVVQHVIDAERIFAYRALRFARGDAQALLSFDENNYAAAANADNRLFDKLLLEMNALRVATDLMLLSFDDEMLARTGTASGSPVTVNALAYIIYGHLLHHKQILQERYLS